MSARWPSRSPSLRPKLRNARDELAHRVEHLLRERFDASRAINSIVLATGGDAFLFGGALRRALLGDKLSGDLDIMVPNGDERVFRELEGRNVRRTLNSQGLRRYHWGGIQLDVFQPREFFGGFADVPTALAYFDLRINALALHFRTKQVLDPFDILALRDLKDPGINWPRWEDMPPVHIVILSIRLTKMIHEAPGFALPTGDAVRLRNEVVPIIRDCDWREVHDRFPEGKDTFLRLFEQSVLRLTQYTPR